MWYPIQEHKFSVQNWLYRGIEELPEPERGEAVQKWDGPPCGRPQSKNSHPQPSSLGSQNNCGLHGYCRASAPATPGQQFPAIAKFKWIKPTCESHNQIVEFSSKPERHPRSASIYKLITSQDLNETSFLQTIRHNCIHISFSISISVRQTELRMWTWFY